MVVFISHIIAVNGKTKATGLSHSKQSRAIEDRDAKNSRPLGKRDKRQLNDKIDRIQKWQLQGAHKFCQAEKFQISHNQTCATSKKAEQSHKSL